MFGVLAKTLPSGKWVTFREERFSACTSRRLDDSQSSTCESASPKVGAQREDFVGFSQGKRSEAQRQHQVIQRGAKVLPEKRMRTRIVRGEQQSQHVDHPPHARH